MNIPQTWKTLLKILALLTGIQLLRIASKALVFSFVERTVWADTLCSAGWTLGALCVFCVWVKEKGVSLSLFPEHFHKGYGISSGLAGAFFIATPLITQNTSPQALLSLVYGAILTVALEELLFRGWVWKQLELLHTGPFPWLVSSVLFGIWHLGYADTVLWRDFTVLPRGRCGKHPFLESGHRAGVGCCVRATTVALQKRVRPLFAPSSHQYFWQLSHPSIGPALAGPFLFPPPLCNILQRKILNEPLTKCC